MDTSELVSKCEEYIGWGLNLHSFTDDFEHYRKFIKDKIDEKDIYKFIEICDNRIERAKTLLKDVATVLGFGIIGTSIISLAKVIVSFLTEIFFWILIVGIIICFFLLVHYRTHIHAWTAFKESSYFEKRYNTKGN